MRVSLAATRADSAAIADANAAVAGQFTLRSVQRTRRSSRSSQYPVSAGDEYNLYPGQAGAVQASGKSFYPNSDVGGGQGGVSPYFYYGAGGGSASVTPPHSLRSPLLNDLRGLGR